MKKRGFTLIELMISLTIFATLSVFLYKVFFYQIRESFDFNNKIEVQYNLNKAVNMISDQLRNNSPNIVVDSSKNKIKNNEKIIIDLNSKESPSDITGNNRDLTSLKVYYNPSKKILWDDNGNKCSNIDSINIQCESNNNEVIEISIYSSVVKTVAAVNIKR
ncbi:type II secretion system GspH family protein [Clostridium tyrobutyricum]|uniref:PulJ/GspJ family protein n=1 Tax=Clostridium tyrobutyricum TaxID=1519 RepID=UPI00073D861B|nr:type II secretion system protein [Clostridium tyrobutyricum]MBV4419775.1 type II secretion system GspH family protein [Clostridium tyrobutyricum]MBV4448389.1 type II secretion system GspH family protein [Clostridium tyrobutyricum]